VAAPASPSNKTLPQVLRGAKVPRCPRCTSDGLAAPLDFLEVQGRVVFQDSQTYRGHWWFADTGEPYTPPGVPAASTPVESPKPASAPRPSS
jgi:hypothetical protein